VFLLPLPKGNPSFLRNQLLARAKNQKLRNVINGFYRVSSKIGDGGLAAAIRETKQTGQLVGGSDHIIKGIETRAALMSVLRSPGLDPGDREIVLQMLRDLVHALNQ